MSRAIRHVPLLAVLMLLLAAAVRQAGETTTTVILVRHAEKADQPADDPPLTPEGAARSRALVEVLRDAGVSAVYSTRWKRTQSTAAPVAAALGIAVTTFDGGAQAQAAEILGKHRGRVVLLVGHSNTVPGIMGALGIENAPAIPDSAYSNLFVVSVPAGGGARYIRASFGR